MRNGRTEQTLKLQLLAFVLALALVWYSLNPTPPRPMARIKREDDVPDEKRREVEPQLQRATILPIVIGTRRAGSTANPLPNQDEDDFDWPDLIDA
ncbi:MAG: hypothetical protein WCF57_09940 [Pyrinomonadaceae bacterium]